MLFRSQKAFLGYNTASLQGSLQKRPTPPSGGNPGTQIPLSTIGQRAFVGHNLASLQGLLQKGPISPSAPNPGTHNPHLTVS